MRTITLSTILALAGAYLTRRLAKNSFKLSVAILVSALSLAINVGLARTTLAQGANLGLPNTNIYALTTDNTIYVLMPGSNGFSRLVRVTNIDGNLIGLDFRPADGSRASVYGLTDKGNLYLINLTQPQLGAATLVSSLIPRFAGGFQSLMDFNPVANALRVIGSNDQNFAVVSNGGNLNQTVVQTALAYAAGDVNAGVDPNITAGAYSNNFAGATQTLFYMIDYDLDTFVTIATRNAAGSSNTGGGQLQTIGFIVNANGNPINFAPTAGLDIYTDANGSNTLVAISGQTLYTIDLSSINPSLPLGTTQNVLARAVITPPAPQGNLPPTGGFIDVAVSPFPPPPADLAVTATDSPDPVTPGKALTYTITVTNLGPSTASGVMLTSENIPLLSYTATTSQGSCSAFSSNLNCNLGTLVSGDSATIIVKSSEPLGDPGTNIPITLVADFSVTSAISDPDLNNNTASVTTTYRRR